MYEINIPKNWYWNSHDGNPGEMQSCEVRVHIKRRVVHDSLVHSSTVGINTPVAVNRKLWRDLVSHNIQSFHLICTLTVVYPSLCARVILSDASLLQHGAREWFPRNVHEFYLLRHNALKTGLLVPTFWSCLPPPSG